MRLKSKRFFSRFIKNLFVGFGLVAAAILPFAILVFLAYITMKNPVLGGFLIAVYLILLGTGVMTWNERVEIEEEKPDA